MVQLDHRILLGGQDFDAVGQLQRAATAAQTANKNRDANALRLTNAVQKTLYGDGNALRSGSGGGGLIGSMRQQQEEQMLQLALTGVDLIKAGRLDEANAMVQQYIPNAPVIRGLDDPNLHAILAQVPGFAEAYQQRIEMGQMINPQAPAPSYELMDINGDGVMEYVDPSNPNAPIVPVPGMQAGPQGPGYDVPEGYMLRDLNNPRAGVMPVPGMQAGPQEPPEVKTVTLPDGREVSMQWDGEQWSPIGAPNGMPPPPPPEIDPQAEQSFRKEFASITDDYRSLRGTLRTMAASASQNNKPGDIALITTFMKMLDPTSVVREGEYQQAAQTGGFMQRAQAAIRALESGSTLTNAQRNEFMELGNQLMEIADRRYGNIKSDFTRAAEEYGFGVHRVIPSTGMEPVRAPLLEDASLPPPDTAGEAATILQPPPLQRPAPSPRVQLSEEGNAIAMKLAAGMKQLNDNEILEMTAIKDLNGRIEYLKQKGLW